MPSFSEQAEAQFRLAEVKLTNAQTLQTRNVASKMQLLEAQAERDIAAAKAKEARSNMQLAELALMEMNFTRRFPASSAAPLSGKARISPRKRGIRAGSPPSCSSIRSR